MQSGLAIKLDAHEPTSFPLAGLYTGTGIWYVSCHRHQKSDCMFSSCTDITTWAVDHDYTKPRGCCNIDIVDADTSSCHDFELLCGFQKICCHFRFGSHKEGIVVGNDLDQLFGSQTFLFVRPRELYEEVSSHLAIAFSGDSTLGLRPCPLISMVDRT